MQHGVKGVIIAAGYGTRFLPATKTVPKEMFPIIDTPAIDFIIDEFIQSGIKDILIVSSRRKKVLEDHLDKEKELEAVFLQENKLDKLEKIRPAQANIFFTRQQTMLGTGHAIYQAKPFTGSSAFVVAYPDDLFFTPGIPVSSQLINLYHSSGKNVLSLKDMGDTDVSRYGVLDVEKSGNHYKVKGIVEKPAVGSEPSKIVSFGRYLFTPDFYDEVEPLLAQHESGELYQTAPLNSLAKKDKVVGWEYEGERFDTGEPLGYVQTIIEYGLRHPKYGEEIKEYIKSIAHRMN